jgi:predicted permease
MYAVVNGVLLRPLPYSNQDRLVAVRDWQPRGVETNVAFPEFDDWRRLAPPSVAGVAAWFNTSMAVTGDGEPEILRGERMSANLPALLGVTPLRGRSFLPDEDRPTAPRVVMISEGLWRARFGADEDIVGRSISLDADPYEVVGVYPSDPRARVPGALASGRRSDMWVPLRLDEASAPRSSHFMAVIARLRPGVPIEQARAQFASLSASLRADSSSTHDLRVHPLARQLVGDTARILYIFLGAVSLLLLIACVNVANLLLAHGVTREREFAVRLALGAGRARVMTQVFVESLLRAVLGGALGIAVAWVAVRTMPVWLPLNLPRFDQVTVDWRVLGAAVVLSIVTGLLFGLAPAGRAVHADPTSVLRAGGRGILGRIGGERFRRTLVVSEIAMSFVLLVGAGLLLRSFNTLASIDTGFDDRDLSVTFVSLPGSRYADTTAQRIMFRRLSEQVSSIPGVDAAAFVSHLPIEGGVSGTIPIEGRTYAEGESQPYGQKRIVGAGYFQLMQATVVEGRLFNDEDQTGGTPSVIVNETFARRWFPGESAVGRRIGFAWNIQGFQTIVGVISDLAEGPQPDGPTSAIYVPNDFRPISGMELLIRSSLDDASLMSGLRQRVATIDHLLPLTPLQPISEVVAEGIARERTSAVIVTTFASLALLLAAVGLYGVVSYSVTQRQHELGIRAALGASPRALLRLVLGQGASFLVLGIAIGTALAVALGRYLSAELHGVTPTDRLTFVGVGLCLAVVALVATILPARRATRIDPLAALRSG